MKIMRYWLLSCLLMGLVACGGGEATPTAVASLPTQETAATSVPLATDASGEVLPTSTSLPPTNTPRPTPIPTNPPAVVNTIAPTALPTDTATPAATNTPAATPTATTPPTTLILPSQQYPGRLAAGETAVYRYSGVAFQPIMLFAQVDATGDLLMASYDGVLAATDLDGRSTLTKADFGQAGIPEQMVFTAPKDGDFTIALTAVSDVEYTLFVYDPRIPATNALIKADTLAAGESKSYPITSEYGHPVLVFVDQTDQTDLAIEVKSGGNTINSANYGGGGSAEALFVLPLTTTDYTVIISEAGGKAASYNVVIVALP